MGKSAATCDSAKFIVVNRNIDDIIRRFALRMNVEDSGIIIIEFIIHIIYTNIKSTDSKITIAKTAPSPVDMKHFIIIISIAHKSMATITKQ